ncbi:hypothetical protein [Corallococcus sp. RDP092CA]|uniref:hypothetical protein n=1 Tax=Corallococcus sp. RDP092CA TaxID=3109369 RepID=UPI0035B25EE9
MTSETTYVHAALLDVLGYRHRLSQDRQSGSLDFKDALQRAMTVLSNFNEAEFSYQAISDTIIVTCARRDGFVELLKVLKKVVLGFLAEGLFVRGGVTYSPHFKSSHVTYSHALAVAHELESKTAIYPRVVIDHNILEMFKVANETKSITDAELICERNGVHFLNIIDPDNWAQAYKWAREMFAREKTFLLRKEQEFLKHSWFEEYLFNSPHRKPDVERYIPTMTLLRPDPPLPSARPPTTEPVAAMQEFAQRAGGLRPSTPLPSRKTKANSRNKKRKQLP